MKVALVYDRVNKWGGAERVLLVLHEMFPEAPLYTSVYNPKTAPWARNFGKIHTSFLQNFPYAQSAHELYAPLMPIAFESFSFDSYDLVISVTSEAAKGIITKPHTRHICYMLTPTRYLWSGYDVYFGNGIKRWITQPVVSYLRSWDKIAAQRPDVMVAISKTVGDRINRYYNRDSTVIYPPVDLPNPKSQITNYKQIQNSKIKIQNGEYFLLVSRLVPYKRVDLAIETFNRLKLPLVIVGTGSEEGRLKGMAGENIHFISHLTDEELARYYKKATALIFPQEEDFGIVAVEAQMMGTPVIAYAAGGVKETIRPGRTGEFFSPQTPTALVNAVQSFDRRRYNPRILSNNVKRFSKERFKKEFLRVLEERS